MKNTIGTSQHSYLCKVIPHSIFQSYFQHLPCHFNKLYSD